MIKIGTFVADGNAVNIECGFKPQYVRLVNITANTAHELFGGLSCIYQYDNSGNSVFAADADGISTYDTASFSETNSVVSASGYQGFTVNADTMSDSDVCYYLAIGHIFEEDHGDQA